MVTLRDVHPAVRKGREPVPEVDFGPSIAPGEPRAERTSFEQVVLVERLCAAVSGSVMQAITAILPPQRGHSSTSSDIERRRRSAHGIRDRRFGRAGFSSPRGQAARSL